MDHIEAIYSEAERQLTLLEQRLSAAESGLYNLKDSLTIASCKLSVLDDVTRQSKRKNHFCRGGICSYNFSFVSDNCENSEDLPFPVPQAQKRKVKKVKKKVGREEEAQPSSSSSSSSDVAKDIEKVLEQEFAPVELIVKSELGRGGSTKIDISIVSGKFEGLAPRSRHKLVQEAARSVANFDLRVHSLTISKYSAPSGAAE